MKKIIKIKRFADFNAFIIDSPDGAGNAVSPPIYRQNSVQTEPKISKKNKNKNPPMRDFPLDLSAYMTRIYQYE